MSKNLGKWQIISLISRFSALFLGLAQSVVITRILTVSEFGLVSLVGAIGAMAGIAQHLGLASGTTREISASKDPNDISKILLSSIGIKYIVTLPIALFMFVSAYYIATNVYSHPEIATPIRLYSLVLVIQGVQSIFNSVIAGLQKFKQLFIYQVAIAAISLVLYIPLIYLFRVDGYFYALVLFNLVGSISLGFIALWPIKDKLTIPTKSEFGGMFKNIFILSMSIYFVKVIYTVWYKFGQLSLGYINAIEAVGIFSFGLLYSSKLLTISDALTDVNLPVFSKEFSTNFENFKVLFRQNFNKLYMLILFAGLSAVYWAKDIIYFVGLGNKYSASFSIITPLILSFAFYSFINILKSSVFIPAKLMKDMIVGYLLMLLGTMVAFIISLVSFYGTYDYAQFTDYLANINYMAIAMFIGAFFGFVSMSLLVKFKLNLSVLDIKVVSFSLFLSLLIIGHFLLKEFSVRFVFYLMHLIVFFYLLYIAKIIDLKLAFSRLGLK